MQYWVARELLGQLKTMRLHARQRGDYLQADALSQKISLLKRKLKSANRQLFHNGKR